MAMTIDGERLNDAIVEKVRKVLDNAERLQKVHIEIDGEIGCMPVIRYRVEELIAPREELMEDVERDK